MDLEYVIILDIHVNDESLSARSLGFGLAASEGNQMTLLCLLVLSQPLCHDSDGHGAVHHLGEEKHEDVGPDYLRMF